MELALTGKRFSALEAEQWGLVNQVVANDVLEEKTLGLANLLCAGPADVLARTKHLFNQSYDVSLPDRLQQEADQFYQSMLKADFTEGVTSFCEKRPAKFNA